MEEEIDLTIVCPSKGRVGKVHTHKFIPSLTLVVPHAEQKAYKEEYPDLKVVSPPKDVKGITATRQWIIEKYDDVFMIDDDVIAIKKLYTGKGEHSDIEDPEEVLGIILRMAYMARDMGAKMFGFGNLRAPLQYRSHQPFKFTGYQNASYCGFLKGHDLNYDVTYKEGEDHYISCLNAYKNRYMFMDTRYGIHTKDNFQSTGGCADYRTQTDFIETTIKLRKTFGNAIHIKSASGGKKNIYKGERTVSLPF